MGDTFTIQISSDLIHRLANTKSKKFNKAKAKAKTSRGQPPQPQGKTNSTSNSEMNISPASKSLFGFPPVLVSPPPQPSPAIAELEAIKSALRESEKVVEKLEKQEINRVQELTQRAKELREKEFKLPYQKPMPCLSEREDCLRCYKEHPNDPLKCASVVKMFAHCAQQARRQPSN